MIVRAVHDSLKDAPPEVIASGWSRQAELHVTRSREYEVHALAVYQGHTHYQVIADIDWPVWLPWCVFEVADSSVPADWRANSFPALGVQLVIGPQFVAGSEDSYQAMVESESGQLDLFWRRARGGVDCATGR